MGEIGEGDVVGRGGAWQAVAVGKRAQVATGVLDRGGRVGDGTVRGEFGAEVPGLGVRGRWGLLWGLLRGLLWGLLRGLLRGLFWGLFWGRRGGVGRVGDDVGLGRL